MRTLRVLGSFNSSACNAAPYGFKHERNYALGMDALLLEDKRHYGLGMDAPVTVCSWHTNEIMVWSWMFSHRMLLEHERDERKSSLGTDGSGHRMPSARA